MRRLIGVALAGAVVFAACSGGGGGGNNKASTEKGREVEQAVKSAGGDFCDLSRNLNEIEQSQESASGDESDTMTPDEVAEFRDALEAMFASLPDDLAAQIDVDLLRRQIEAFLEYFEVTGGELLFDEGEASPEVAEKLAALEAKYADLEERSEDIAADQAKFDSYVETECGVDMDDDGDTDGDPDTSGSEVPAEPAG